MKTKLLKSAVFILIFAITLSTVAFAVEARSSSYIWLTDESISASNGKVTVEFGIQATGIMTNLGVEKIVFYTSSGTPVKTYKYTDTGYSYLMGSSKLSYSGSISYTGTPGTSYYAVITYYASNSSGSDSVTATTSSARA